MQIRPVAAVVRWGLGMVVLGLLGACASSTPGAARTVADGGGALVFDDSTGSRGAAPARSLDASDGTPIAYREYVPAAPAGVVILMHGGGAHSGAGYPATARALRDEFSLVVITPDLRGHGESGGARGSAPSTGRVYDDLDELIEFVSQRWPGLPLTLAGHSSGAGLLVNYTAHRDPPADVSRFAFIAPFLGFRSATERSDPERAFSTSTTWPFVVNAMSFGLLLRGYPAVRFAYPDDVLRRDHRLLTSISVSMANAVTPANPQRDLRRIAPLAIWIGADDEVVDPAKLSAFVDAHAPGAAFTVLPAVSHLGILESGARALGAWITSTGSRS